MQIGCTRLILLLSHWDKLEMDDADYKLIIPLPYHAAGLFL